MRTHELPVVTALRYAVLLFGGVLMLAPFAYMLGTSFKPNAFVLEIPPQFFPRQPTLDNYARALTSGRFGQYFLNSFVVATSASAISLVISSMMAYGFARWSFPGKTVLFYAILGTMMIPGLTLIIPQFVLAKNLHLLNSLWGLVIAYSAGTAFNMFLLRGFFEELPQELFDSATVDGAGAFQTFWKIAMPLAKPAMAAVIIFSFLGAWDEFTWALTAINNPDLYTLPIALRLFQQRYGTEWGLVFAASVVIVTPPIIVFLFFQRHFIKGVTSGAIKG